MARGSQIETALSILILIDLDPSQSQMAAHLIVAHIYQITVLSAQSQLGPQNPKSAKDQRELLGSTVITTVIATILFGSIPALALILIL